MTHITCIVRVLSAAAVIAVAPSTEAQRLDALPVSHAPIKAAGPAFAKEPISAERLAALQRPKDGVPIRRVLRMGALPRALASEQAPQQLAGRDGLMLDHVLFDQPGDGSLWAVGNTYKASFTPEGFTYIPRFGGNAPRNFPISFTLHEVRIGDYALSLQPVASQRAGMSVAFDRGALTESYQLALESVEQTFTFTSRPAGSGDLVICMKVHSELRARESADGLLFANDYGSVTYSSAVVVDAAGQRTGVPTRLVDRSANSSEQSAADNHSLNADRLIEIEVPASLLASAAYPIVIDPIIETHTVATGFNASAPDVAYNPPPSDVYRMVFEHNFSATDGDIYSYRLAGFGGSVIPDSLTVIDSSGANWRRPKIASNQRLQTFFVVAETGFAPSRVIRGRIASADNIPPVLDGQFTIAHTVNYPGDQVHADVGGDPFEGDGTNYCVVWQNEFSAADHDILACVVNGLGSGGPATVIEVDYSTNDDINPAISNSNSTSQWAVCWERIFSVSDHDIYAAAVSWDGGVFEPTFAVDSSFVDNRNPRVSSNMNTSIFALPRFAFVYEEAPATLGDVYMRLLNGTSISAGANITFMDGVTQPTRAPVVDSNASKFVVAYEEFWATQPPSASNWDAYASTFCVVTGSSVVEAERHRQVSHSLAHDSQLMLATKFSGSDPGILSNDNPLALVVWGRSGVISNDISDASYTMPTSCSLPDTNHNGIVNVDDLLAVISGWGVCTNCAADINGDSVVNVDDLLAVIGGWGPSP